VDRLLLRPRGELPTHPRCEVPRRARRCARWRLAAGGAVVLARAARAAGKHRNPLLSHRRTREQKWLQSFLVLGEAVERLKRALRAHPRVPARPSLGRRARAPGPRPALRPTLLRDRYV